MRQVILIDKFPAYIFDGDNKLCMPYLWCQLHSQSNQLQLQLELVYLPKGKYCVYPRMVNRLAIVMPPPPPPILDDEYHFRSHFSPFQINTQLWFFSQNGCWRPFWMTENHFRSHFSPFQINMQLFFFTKWLPAAILDQYTTFIFIFSKWPPPAILEVRFAPKTIGFFHYVLSMAMPNMKLIGEFMTQL